MGNGWTVAGWMAAIGTALFATAAYALFDIWGLALAAGAILRWEARDG